MRSPWSRRRLVAVLVPSALLALGAGDTGELPPGEQLRRLEETGLGLARKVVEARQPLVPFAFVVRDDGRTQRLSARSSRLRRGEDASAALVEGLRERATSGAYRAVAVFRFVSITLAGGEESSAIYISLEHASGRCGEIFVPYREEDDHAIRFEPEMRRSRVAEFFPRCDPPQPTGP